ncbi:hypothetical protein Tco_1162958 [Tanacetum coccineum]
MSTLTFADTHNMVVFLEKPAESDGFHEIIDFLNSNQIHYTLTINPTIYTSCIEQFWATSKTSIRSDLHLEDADGTDCLPTATIFEELARMGAKTTAWNEFSSTMASAIICLATNQKFNLSKNIFDAMIPITTQLSTSNPHKKQSRRKQTKNTEVPHTSDSTTDVPNEEHVPIHSNDPLLNVKRLEKKAALRTHKFKRLYEERSRIEAIERDAEVTLVETQRRNDENDDNLMFDTGVFDGDEIVVETEEPVINAATTIKSIPQRAKGIAFKEPVESTVTIIVPSQKTNDKGKAIMIEPEKPLMKKDQMALDEELARKIEAE